MINEAIESAIETGIARKLTLVDKDVKFSPVMQNFQLQHCKKYYIV